MVTIIQNTPGQVLTTTLPATAINVMVGTFYEGNDPITALAPAVPTSGTTYSYTLTSTDTGVWGNNAVIWQYNLSTDIINISTGSLPLYSAFAYYNVYVQYSSATDFFADYPTLEAPMWESYTMAERRMRFVVEQYCRESFGFMPGRTFVLTGDNSDRMSLPYRLNDFTNVYKDFDTTNNITYNVRIVPESPYFLTHRTHSLGTDKSEDYERFFNEFEELQTGRYFGRKHTYHITGDFGWPFVPTQVAEATRILIADFFNQDSDLRRHQVVEQTAGGRVGILQKFNPDQYGTTGNLDADYLLQEYVRHGWSIV